MGTRSADGCDNIRIALSHFTAFTGPIALEAITADVWDRWYDHCQGKVAERNVDEAGRAGWTSDYAAKVFGVVKTFLKWLEESARIETLAAQVT